MKFHSLIEVLTQTNRGKRHSFSTDFACHLSVDKVHIFSLNSKVEKYYHNQSLNVYGHPI